ncbi:MAG: metallophosphoesterase [Clostridiales bacterium]|nr:metallophosphoesterase [Clostridiales bacterium]
MHKPVLRFNGDGHFRILMVSDFHIGNPEKLRQANKPDHNAKLIDGLYALIKETKPDFVMVGGDQCLDVETEKEAQDLFGKIMNPVIENKIPWAAVFGNHDNEVGLSVKDEEKVYEKMPYCLNKTDCESLSGAGNFCLNIMSNSSDKTAFNLFALDSHREITDFIDEFDLRKGTKLILPEHFNDGQTGATADFEQVMWYYNKSKEFEMRQGKKIPALIFMHIPLPEYLHIVRNPEECGAIGSKRETLGCCELNFGLLAACLQRGDVKGIFFGHEHLCDIQGEYCGITMAQDCALGYNMSCHDDLRGGRVIDIFESGEIQTHAVKLIDIMGIKAMRRPDYFEGGCKYYIRKL